jgi:hypothetical protein
MQNFLMSTIDRIVLFNMVWVKSVKMHFYKNIILNKFYFWKSFLSLSVKYVEKNLFSGILTNNLKDIYLVNIISTIPLLCKNRYCCFCFFSKYWFFFKNHQIKTNRSSIKPVMPCKNLTLI